MNTVNTATVKRVNVRKMTMTAMLSAVAFILMFLDFSVPIMPAFIKMDLSELPALIGTFAMGPVSGVVICLIKNLLHLLMTDTGGVGELSNFLLGAVFVLPAGWIYKNHKGRKNAVIGAVLGALLMGIISIASNYFIVYPVYYNFMSKEAILAAYQALPEAIPFLPRVDSMLEALVKYNAPFTFVKGLFSVIITVLIYKHISPFLKGNHRK